MNRIVGWLIFLMGSSFFLKQIHAQEFPVEYIAHTQLASGFQTRLNNTPDLFFADLRFVPQYTIVKSKLRGGVVAGVFYADKEIGAMAGPTLSVLLWPIRARLSGNGETAGTLGNVHLNLQHLWGTDGRYLAGGGIGLDLGNRIVLGLQSYRDYKQGYWCFQSSLGFRTSKVKSPVQTFPH